MHSRGSNNNEMPIFIYSSLIKRFYKFSVAMHEYYITILDFVDRVFQNCDNSDLAFFKNSIEKVTFLIIMTISFGENFDRFNKFRLHLY